MPSTAPTSSRVDRVARFAAKAAVVVLGVFFALLLGIRAVVYPQLEAHRRDIAGWLGARIGHPVEIDAIVTGWDGWNPRLSIRGFRVHDGHGTGMLLDLPRVDLLIAWTSLPRLDLRLKELTIDSPRLAVRRDARGRLHVAGLEVSGDDTSDDFPFANWVLRQPQVIVRDALVTWNDELRHAPQLLLDHVQFRLEQRFGRHEAGLTGVPPPELAGPIDLRADLTGMARRDFSHVRGKLYFRLDYADVAAWREWLPLPFGLETGRGALRAWVDVADGQARGGVADLELADVRTALGKHLAPLVLAHLAGRAEWKQAPGRTSFEARGLSFALPDGSTVGPTDVAFNMAEATPGSAGSGNLAVGEIELQPLAAIAAHLPLPDAVRRDIVRFAPQGSVHDARFEWSGDPVAPQRYLVAADVRRFGVASLDGLPGVAGLSGRLEMNEYGGKAHVAGDGSTLALPRIFADPLAFDSISGDVLWQSGNGATKVQWKGVSFANGDVAGTTDGTWDARTGGPGSVELTGQLTRANLASTYRYVPVSAPQALRDWLHRALVKGSSGDARLALAGDLALFPFEHGSDGRFKLEVKARGVTLAYADRWTPITDVAGDVRIDGTRVVVDASGARMNGVEIGATRAEIAELRNTQPVLQIKGTARGPTPQFLAFIAASPLAEWIGHVTDAITATGDGQLALEFALPLHDPRRTTLTGGYRFASSEVRLSPALQLSDATGEFAFTEQGVRASGISAQVFGGPLTLGLTAEDAHVRIDARGTADVGLVRAAFDAAALARVAGNTDWQLALDAQGGEMTWSVQSSLAGVSVDLPAPIGKAASETRALRIERHATKAQEDAITIDYGRIARVLAHRRASGTTTSIDRALVLVGKSIGNTTPPERDGVWIRADLSAIDVDAWLEVDPMHEGPATAASVPGLAIDGVDLQAASATVLGRSFSNVNTTARRRNGEWRLTLDGNEISGNATWRGATPAQPQGRITARLTRFSLPPATQSTEGTAPITPSVTSHWPAVDLVADNVVKRGRALGRLELLAQPSGSDWQITKLALASDAGRIDAHGSWRDAATRSRTQLDVAIDVREAGAFLGRLGWPDAVKGAPTKIEGQVAWAGSPSDFDYPSLAGHLTLRAGAGQFTKLEPGMGRLLGVLSLQALPRRVSLDFRDVFSEGFAFDSITGDVRIDRGVMHTDNLRLSGPAAGVEIAGDVDLGHETQKLDVRVQPSLSTGVSAGAAALFIANPLLGAAIGAGALLAQKMLNNPFDQLFSYRYAVSGSFDDPVVARANARAASAEPFSATVR